MVGYGVGLEYGRLMIGYGILLGVSVENLQANEYVGNLSSVLPKEEGK